MPTIAQQVLLSRVLPMLAATGLRYAVQLEDGSITGDLPIAVEPVTTGVRRPKLYNWIKSHDYQTVLDAMPVGASHIFEAGPDLGPKLQKPLCSYATQIWGSGTYMTTVYADGSSVEILRFA